MREYFPNTPKYELIGEALDIVKLDPKLAYRYALNFIQAPFPDGESAIARSAKYSFRYAINILQARFPAGEKVIKKSNYAQQYKEWFKITEW